MSYFAKVNAADWDAVTDALVEYWLKVAEVLPLYYAGKAGPDPLAAEPPETIPPDNGWNRIVCIIDVVYGKFTTHLCRGSQRPRHMDRLWVIATFPMIDHANSELPRGRTKAGGNALYRQMHTALATAAKREPARTALKELRHWRNFRLWVMHESEPETLRPLSGADKK